MAFLLGAALLGPVPACTSPCTYGTSTWVGGGTVVVQITDAVKGKPTEIGADGLAATELGLQASLNDRTGAYAEQDGSSLFFDASLDIPAGAPSAGWSGGWLQASFWSSTNELGAGAHAPSSDESIHLVAGGASLSDYDSASLDLVDSTHATLKVDSATFACSDAGADADSGPDTGWICTWDGTGPLWVTVTWSMDDTVSADQKYKSCPQ